MQMCPLERTFLNLNNINHCILNSFWFVQMTFRAFQMLRAGLWEL